MKKFMMFAFLGLSLALTGCDACTENVLDKLGDSIATMGKSGIEKDQALMERKASRAAKCAEQKAAEAKKSLGF